jgi:hypothetical protein
MNSRIGHARSVSRSQALIWGRFNEQYWPPGKSNLLTYHERRSHPFVLDRIAACIDS